MKTHFSILFAIFVLCLGVVAVVSCGDDDDDDNDNETGEVTFGEDGLVGDGNSSGGPFGVGGCSQAGCEAMLTFMDECAFHCVDVDQNPIPCTELLDYCVGCTGNWGCNVTCYTGQTPPDGCLDFLQCCMDCTE